MTGGDLLMMSIVGLTIMIGFILFEIWIGKDRR